MHRKINILAPLLWLAATAAAVAVPEPDTTGPAPAAPSWLTHSTFSFASWVDSLVADPSTALTPEQAIEAYNAGLESENKLEKRQTFANCDQKGPRPAKVPEMVWCINWLAGRGRNGEQCGVSNGPIAQCTWYDAQIVTVQAGGNSPSSVNCNEIAKAGGLVMDRCFRADNTVAGQAILPGVAVHLQMPLI